MNDSMLSRCRHCFAVPHMIASAILMLGTTGAVAAQDLPAGTPSPAVAAETVAAAAAAIPDSGNVAWMLTSTFLVLLMVVPGLAMFYGGMVRSKNVLSVFMQVLLVFCVAVILWIAYGYSAVFTAGNPFFGSFTEKAFLKGVAADSISNGLPEFLYVAFQSTFAGITTALVVGSFAERMKFRAVMLFSILWFTFAYLPMAHIVWGGGYLAGIELAGAEGALDFAGGTVVHINAGVAGLVGAWFLGRRLGYGREAIKPHNVPFTVIGAALLWVGWFGFNAGSALAADSVAALAFINTLVATAAAVIGWSLVEAFTKGRPSALGAASGAIAGLVGITPAAGFVGPLGSIAIGFAAGVTCVWGVTGLKRLLGADDSLDVFGVHGIGGIVGAILTGVFAAPSLGGVKEAGYSIGGQVAVQVVSVLFTILWCAIVTAIALFIARLVCAGLRVGEDEEREGLDITSHGESAYES